MGAGVARQDSAAFRIGPLTTYADTAAMACWLEAAEPGDEMIYATGPVLGDHAAARLARTMQEGGLVTLFQRRSGKPNCFDYCARKNVVCATESLAGATPSVLEHPIPDPMTLPLDEGRVYQCVAQAARDGEACPSLARLASRCRLKNRRRADYLLDRLCELGLLEKQPRPAGARRDAPTVFTVVLLGKATASQPPPAVAGATGQKRATRGDTI